MMIPTGYKLCREVYNLFFAGKCFTCETIIISDDQILRLTNQTSPGVSS